MRTGDMAEDSEGLHGLGGDASADAEDSDRGLEGRRQEGQGVPLPLVARPSTREALMSREGWEQLMSGVEKLQHGMDTLLRASKVEMEDSSSSSSRFTGSDIPPRRGQKKVVRKNWGEKPKWLEEAMTWK